MLSWYSQHDIVIQKREYLSLQDNVHGQSCQVTDGNIVKLGSPRQLETFFSIDAVEGAYGFCGFHLSIQS